MDRLIGGGMWSVFDPVDVPDLRDAFGPDFTALYEDYEKSGLAIFQYDVDEIWAAIYQSQTETGTPYIVFQDNINSAVLSLSYCVLISNRFFVRRYSAKQSRSSRNHPFG